MADPHRHVPVCCRRVVELLAPAMTVDAPVIVDATEGLGGHSQAFLDAFPEVRLVGLDRDPAAVEMARLRLQPYGERAQVVHARYDRIGEVLDGLGISRVQGVFFDLGVSSMQIDDDGRGFAYSRPAPLDMRMDPTTGITAAEVVNTYSAGDLSRILWEYGQERQARRIARAIVAARPLSTSEQLVAVVDAAIPAAVKKTGGHPAKRTFQAIRIEVNGELDSLAKALPESLRRLAVGGRIVVLSYHSLEDRMVKEALRRGATDSAPLDLPVVPPDSRPWLRLITRGSEVASMEEVADNPRARSVRLRGAEKVREAA